ncbi:MAG: hypothetical protein F8N37_05260 [Telmatospirillum sp.]|nr:hypothetical protein [Telmatospirillum sp.]
MPMRSAVRRSAPFLPAVATAVALSFLSVALPALPAAAAVTERDVLAAARALTFLEHPPRGTVDIGVAVDPADAASVKDADLIRRTIGNGLVIGDLTIHARLISRADVASSEGIGALMIAGGSMDLFREAAAVGRTRQILTVSTDPACVQAALCVMLVKSDPKVQVFVNPRVAEQDGIAFTPTFNLMIKEVP